jgi:hypothetical protein
VLVSYASTRQVSPPAHPTILATAQTTLEYLIPPLLHHLLLEHPQCTICRIRQDQRSSRERIDEGLQEGLEERQEERLGPREECGNVRQGQ